MELLDLLGPALSGIAATAAIGWGLKRARQPAVAIDSSDTRVLRYPAIWAWLGIVAMLLSAGICAAAFLFAPEQIEQDGPVILGVFGALFALGLVFWLEMSVTAAHVSGHEIVLRSPWKGERRMAWNQVEEVRYSPQWTWYTLRSSDGTRMRIHRLLSGLPTFSELVLRQLEPRVYAQAVEELQRDIGA